MTEPVRRRLPDERQAITHKFQVAQHTVYLTVGLFENGQPGELFICTAKEGSTISGLLSTVAILTSMALQYGVPLKTLTDKFSYTNFEPSGWTTNPEIRHASSVVDYVFRWLAHRFMPETRVLHTVSVGDMIGVVPKPPGELPLVPGKATDWTPALFTMQSTDAPPCVDCGCIMVRSGACYKCMNCGGTSGCS